MHSINLSRGRGQGMRGRNGYMNCRETLRLQNLFLFKKRTVSPIRLQGNKIKQKDFTDIECSKEFSRKRPRIYYNERDISPSRNSFSLCKNTSEDGFIIRKSQTPPGYKNNEGTCSIAKPINNGVNLTKPINFFERHSRKDVFERTEHKTLPHRERVFPTTIRRSKRELILGNFGRPINYPPSYDISPDRTASSLQTNLIDDRNKIFAKMIDAKRTGNLDEYYRYRDLLNEYDRKHRNDVKFESDQAVLNDAEKNTANENKIDFFQNDQVEKFNENENEDMELNEFCDLEEVDHCGEFQDCDSCFEEEESSKNTNLSNNLLPVTTAGEENHLNKWCEFNPKTICKEDTKVHHPVCGTADENCVSKKRNLINNDASRPQDEYDDSEFDLIEDASFVRKEIVKINPTKQKTNLTQDGDLDLTLKDAIDISILTPSIDKEGSGDKICSTLEAKSGRRAFLDSNGHKIMFDPKFVPLFLNAILKNYVSLKKPNLTSPCESLLQIALNRVVQVVREKSLLQ